MPQPPQHPQQGKERDAGGQRAGKEVDDAGPAEGAGASGSEGANMGHGEGANEVVDASRREDGASQGRGAGTAAAGSRRRPRVVLRGLLALAALVAIMVPLLGCCVFSAPRYRGPHSDHFDGKRFRNAQPVQHAGFRDLVRWMWTREPGPWREQRSSEPGTPPPRRVGTGELVVTFVNHSTVLIQMEGLSILTDPIWSERASPVSWAGPRRVRPPGIRFEDLPPIDVVLVSHNHYDHLDLPTLARLAREHRPLVLTGLGNRRLLEARGVPGAKDLDWWQTVELAPGVRASAVPAQHFSGRGLADRDRSLWVGFVIEGPAGAVYFAGDTGWGPHFAQIRQRFGPPRLAVLPIGAFRPRWFMSRVHISPEEAVRAHRLLGAGTSLAVHFGTFRLADDGQEEAPARLGAALDETGESRRSFWVLGFGENRAVPAARAAPAARVDQ